MATYITLINYTDQGIRSIKEMPQRLADARRAIEGAGAKMSAFYLTMGQYDAVAVVEGPSDEVAAAVLLSIAGQGNIRTTTLKAFPESQIAAILGKVR